MLEIMAAWVYRGTVGAGRKRKRKKERIVIVQVSVLGAGDCGRASAIMGMLLI